ncbi:MAG TPA: MCE family protein [Marmoricola sp.]|jgi:phospholipid/cholesterol/gamma-HCH transport system substrate-binding protein|nr:MCE family protein [Marmoricola sp.]
MAPAKEETQTVSAVVGVIAVVAAFALVALSVALYSHKFTKTDDLTVQSSRAGLMMTKGGAVKLRGVEIGTVAAVRSTSDGADIDLKVDRRYLSAIPDNVGAQIVPTTVFGNKYVDLTVPSSPGPAIPAGSVITADHVTVEVNSTFESLMGLLDAVKPSQINSALTSLSTALQGNGTTAAHFIGLLDTYLGQINPQLPQFNSDVTQGVKVAGEYADLAPDLVNLAKNGTTVSDTLVANKASLDALLISFTHLANSTGTLASANETNLDKTLQALDPTTKLLARYAPEFPCTFQGLAVDNTLATRAFGLVQQGINAVVGLLPAQSPYEYPTDLPDVRADSGPQCYGLPNLTPGKIPAHEPFDIGGTNPYAGDVTGGGTAGTKGGLAPVYMKQLFESVLGLGHLL